MNAILIFLRLKHYTGSLLSGLLLFTIFIYSQPLKAELMVIVNPSVKIESISPVTLSRIYAMQSRKWPSGQAVKVFTFSPESEVFEKFTVDIARVQTHQLNRHWNRLVFTGKGRVPIQISNTQEMIHKVRSTPGAIGYIDSESIPKSVRRLKIGEPR